MDIKNMFFSLLSIKGLVSILLFFLMIIACVFIPNDVLVVKIGIILVLIILAISSLCSCLKKNYINVFWVIIVEHIIIFIIIFVFVNVLSDYKHVEFYNLQLIRKENSSFIEPYLEPNPFSYYSVSNFNPSNLSVTDALLNSITIFGIYTLVIQLLLSVKDKQRLDYLKDRKKILKNIQIYISKKECHIKKIYAYEELKQIAEINLDYKNQELIDNFFAASLTNNFDDIENIVSNNVICKKSDKILISKGYMYASVFLRFSFFISKK